MNPDDDDDHHLHIPHPPRKRSMQQVTEDEQLLTNDKAGASCGIQVDAEPSSPPKLPASVYMALGEKKKPSWKNFAVLITLYFCQGIPMGLISGTIPFLLKGLDTSTSTHGYASLGLISLASQPYNLKLLWSPLVDSIYDKRLGRRKSWMIPMLTIIGIGFLYIGYLAPDLFPSSGPVPFARIAMVFGCLIACCATLDVAVDGWALTLLDRNYTKYSSTCQTIGLNAGYFFAFTIYLSLASAEFCNTHLRQVASTEPILDLGTFLQCCGLLYLLSIILVVRMKPENQEIAPRPGSVRMAYAQMFRILSLPNVRLLSTALVIGKLGFMVGDTLTPLKLIDKGFHKEDLAAIVFVDFIVQLVLSWVALGWFSQERPLRPWQAGCFFKTIMALLGMWIVGRFPADGEVTTGYFWLVLVHSILSSFASTMMLVTLNAFFSTVCDPTVGGTYMTLLNTFSNIGSTWPRLLSLSMVDRFTKRLCRLDPMMAASMTGVFDDSCGTDEAMATCQRLGGSCMIVADGYYLINSLAVFIGLLIMHIVVRPLIWKVEGTPISTWRIT